MPEFVKSRVRFLSAANGGRVVMPTGNGYAPYIRATSLPHDLPIRVNGLPDEGKFEKEYEVTLELTYTSNDYSPLSKGVPFLLVEGSRVVAEGRITSLTMRTCPQCGSPVPPPAKTPETESPGPV